MAVSITSGFAVYYNYSTGDDLSVIADGCFGDIGDDADTYQTYAIVVYCADCYNVYSILLLVLCAYELGRNMWLNIAE